MKKYAARITAILLFTAVLGGSVFAMSVYGPQRPVNAIDLPGAKTINEVGTSATTVTTATSKPFMSTMFSNQAELVATLKKNGLFYSGTASNSDDSKEAAGAITDGATASPTSPPGGETGEAPSENFSKTNTQVADIDEADVIKTDGNYIYYLNFSAGIAIIKADGGKMERVSTIKPNKNESISDMYLRGDSLIVMGNRYDEQDDTATGVWRYNAKSYTTIAVYDIKNRTAPSLLRTVELEGSIIDTRMSGDILYYVVNKYIFSLPEIGYRNEDILPTYYDSATGKDCVIIAPENIGYIPGSEENSYLLVGALDITADTPLMPNVCLGAGNTVYMSDSNLYVTRTKYDATTNDEATAIVKFAINGTEIYAVGEGNVPGSIINKYALDEYDGKLRVATTSWNNSAEKSENNMFVLDGAMNISGRLTGLAPNERIYSVRFMQDKAYMVTYETMDPLFVIGLANPNAPVVLGELKIPGFSQYLHPIGNGYLVGIGRSTSETFVKNDDGSEEVVGAVDRGLKLSLFDVNDVMNPREVAKLTIGGQYTYSNASYEPKTIMVDSQKGIFAFPLYYDDGGQRNESSERWSGGIVVSVSPETGFAIKTKVPSDEDKFYDCSNSRFCYIGNTLYMASGRVLKALNYDTFETLGSYTFFNNDEMTQDQIVCGAVPMDDAQREIAVMK